VKKIAKIGYFKSSIFISGLKRPTRFSFSNITRLARYSWIKKMYMHFICEIIKLEKLQLYFLVLLDPDLILVEILII